MVSKKIAQLGIWQKVGAFRLQRIVYYEQLLGQDSDEVETGLPVFLV